jgi:hypothetical protein
VQRADGAVVLARQHQEGGSLGDAPASPLHVHYSRCEAVLGKK